MKVYLQKPLGITDSAYYKYLREFPPKGIKYSAGKNFKVLVKGKKFKRSFWLKQFIKRNLRKFRISLPNAYLSKNIEGYDLIHCTHCTSKNKFPWVADFEYIGQFWFGSNSNKFSEKSKKKVRKYLTSEFCKKLMPWSEWSKKNILKEFPELRNKIEIVYPAVPVPNFKKIGKKDKICILFIGRDFEMKGGEIVVKVLDILTQKYDNVEGIIISDVPPKILKKYGGNKRIKFVGLVSQEKLFGEIYPSSDIFLYPTFSDTMGFAILEAQGFGLPVLAQKTRSTHTLDETIQEGKTGFIINNSKTNGHDKKFDEEIINKFIDKCETLIKNKKLLKQMSKNAQQAITKGRFSIKERNKKLKKIYEEALKK